MRLRNDLLESERAGLGLPLTDGVGAVLEKRDCPATAAGRLDVGRKLALAGVEMVTHVMSISVLDALDSEDCHLDCHRLSGEAGDGQVGDVRLEHREPLLVGELIARGAPLPAAEADFDVVDTVHPNGHTGHLHVEPVQVPPHIAEVQSLLTLPSVHHEGDIGLGHRTASEGRPVSLVVLDLDRGLIVVEQVDAHHTTHLITDPTEVHLSGDRGVGAVILIVGHRILHSRTTVVAGGKSSSGDGDENEQADEGKAHEILQG
jgi:hypothetical protein